MICCCNAYFQNLERSITYLEMTYEMMLLTKFLNYLKSKGASKFSKSKKEATIKAWKGLWKAFSARPHSKTSICGFRLVARII